MCLMVYIVDNNPVILCVCEYISVNRFTKNKYQNNRIIHKSNQIACVLFYVAGSIQNNWLPVCPYI